MLNINDHATHMAMVASRTRDACSAHEHRVPHRQGRPTASKQPQDHPKAQLWPDGHPPTHRATNNHPATNIIRSESASTWQRKGGEEQITSMTDDPASAMGGSTTVGACHASRQPPHCTPLCRPTTAANSDPREATNGRPHTNEGTRTTTA